MDLQNRINLLVELGEYMQSDQAAWKAAKTRTSQHNAWFIPDFVDLSVHQIVRQFLQRALLEKWVKDYNIPTCEQAPKKVGIVMAGNIPLVGFHDFLCGFLSGHQLFVKLL